MHRQLLGQKEFINGVYWLDKGMGKKRALGVEHKQ